MDDDLTGGGGDARGFRRYRRGHSRIDTCVREVERAKVLRGDLPPGTCLMRGDRWRTEVTFGGREATGEVGELSPGVRAFLVRLRREGETNLGDSGRRTTEYRLTPANSLGIPTLIDHVELNSRSPAFGFMPAR